MNISSLKSYLAEFDKVVKEEISNVLQGNKVYPRVAQTKSFNDLKTSLNQVIEDVARTGDCSSYDWKVLRSLIVYRTRETLRAMQDAYPDCKNTPTENFEALLEGVTQLFLNFEEK
eukprot:TRINITY_DN6385_c0_g1_i3.p1 TRINITY_DN6385_c0_g1~~TRINITY_DN6385_c0_g1_i3.p1  ORF type:complete len:116 (-),score=33.63 TRINITY_DN6385_c0_g1_i3:310-657(-)